MNLSRFFIDRPIFAAVLSVFIVVMGLAAYPLLPLSQYPEIAPPTVRISATYSGADSPRFSCCANSERAMTASPSEVGV